MAFLLQCFLFHALWLEDTSTPPLPALRIRLLVDHCFLLIHHCLRKVFPEAPGLGEHLLWAPSNTYSHDPPAIPPTALSLSLDPEFPEGRDQAASFAHILSLPCLGTLRGSLNLFLSVSLPVNLRLQCRIFTWIKHEYTQNAWKRTWHTAGAQ